MAQTQIVLDRTRGIHSNSASSSHGGRFGATIVEPLRRSKLNLEDIFHILGPNKHKQLEIFTALFSGPVVRRSNPFKNDHDASKWVSQINQDFRAQFGTDAIIKTSISGTGRSQNFWIAILNPELFEVSEHKLIPRVHVGLEDIFPSTHVKIILTIAKNNFCTKEELRSAGISESQLALVLQKGLINARFRKAKDNLAVELHSSILSTRTQPILYFVDPKFAEAFGIKLGRREPTLSKVLSFNQLRLIQILASNERLKKEQVAKRLELEAEATDTLIASLNRRCEELGWPQAVIVAGKHKSHYCILNPAFIDKHEIPAIEKRDINAYFSGREIDVINFIIRNPLTTHTEIATFLSVTDAYINELITKITRKCKELEEQTQNGRKLPLLMIVSKHDSKFAFSPEFHNMFGFDLVPKDPLKAVHVPSLVEVYLLFKSGKTNKEAALQLGKDERQIASMKVRINRRLAAAGFQPLPSTLKKRGLNDLERLKDLVIKFRSDTGAWQSNEFIVALDKMSITRDRIIARQGSLTSALATVMKMISEADTERILVSDLQKLSAYDFSKFDGTSEDFSSKDIRLACTGALRRGTEFASILSILNSNSSVEFALKLVNQESGD